MTTTDTTNNPDDAIVFVGAWCPTHSAFHVCAYAGAVRVARPRAPGERCPLCHAARVPVELQADCDCADVPLR